MGNKFPEPMSVFRNQVIRKVVIFRNHLNFIGITLKGMAFEINYEGLYNLCIVT